MSVETPSYGRAAAQFSELKHVGQSKGSLHELVETHRRQLVVRQAEEAQATMEMPSKETGAVRREIPEPASAFAKYFSSRASLTA